MIKYIKLSLIVSWILIFSTPTSAAMLFIGDSQTPTIYDQLQSIDNINSLYYRISSGLGNTKFFNWFQILPKLGLNQYDRIIICLGTNDFDFHGDYTKRVQKLLDMIPSTMKIIWIGPPNSPFISSQINKTIQSTNRNIIFIDTTSSKVELKLDRIHFTPIGAKVIAKEILERLKK